MPDPDVLARIAQTKERAARTQRFFDEPGSFDHVVASVTNGGSVLELAETLDIRYSDVMRWIHADPSRDKAYSQALKDRNEWGIESLLLQIKRVANSDLRMAFTADGKLKPVKDWPPELAAAVAAVEVEDGACVKIKLWDKTKGADMLFKFHGLFVQKVEHSGKLTLEDLLVQSTQEPVK